MDLRILKSDLRFGDLHISEFIRIQCECSDVAFRSHLAVANGNDQPSF
ncbi:hypothetical protein FHX10_006653 [Rhizobium sp. BK591]|nr:hypothetical protein [Rhizobium sp. BK591]MBB3747100.1 hypothetical protein [Rhizobium sp. BK591]